MSPTSSDRVLETLRRRLHAAIQRYAALLPDMRHADIERELIDLAAMLSIDWPGDFSPEAYRANRRRLCTLLESLVAAAREDQQAAYQRRISTMMASDSAGDAAPLAVSAVDRWLERWLSGKEAGRLP